MGTYCKMFLSIYKFISIKKRFLRAKSSAIISSIAWEYFIPRHKKNCKILIKVVYNCRKLKVVFES